MNKELKKSSRAVDRVKAKILANLGALKEDFKEGFKDSAVGQVILWYADLHINDKGKIEDRAFSASLEHKRELSHSLKS